MQAQYPFDTTPGQISQNLLPGSIRCIRYINSRPAVLHRLFFEENVILFVDEGEFKFHYGNTVFTIGRKQFAAFRKNTLLEQECVGESGSCILIVVKKDWLTEVAQNAPVSSITKAPTGPVIIRNVCSNLLVYIASLYTYLQEKNNIAECLARIKILELLYWFSQHDSAIFRHLLDIREHFYAGITAIVEENIMNNLSVKDLAKLSGRSLSSFRREFLSVYNQVPAGWIRQKKLEKARELLAGTSMTVTDICYTLGFESISHFSRLYKSRFGFSPSRQRNGLMEPARL